MPIQKQQSRQMTKWLVCVLLTAHVMMLAYSAYVNSPTLNEPGHLAAGISYLKHQRFELYRVNPPLVRMLGALPVVAVGAETNWGAVYESPGARPIYHVAPDFVNANGQQIFWLVTLARWACIPLSLIGAIVVYSWTSKLYSPHAGLLSLSLWCFSPNILAHGQLITCDMGATSLGVAAAYLFWRWLRNSTWTAAIFAGTVLGLAELTKMTLLIYFPLWLLLWLFWLLSKGDEGFSSSIWLKQLPQLVCILGIAIYVINLGYACEGSLEKLGDLPFVSETLTSKENSENRFAESWLGQLPIPLPRNYLLGLDIQKRDLEGIDYPSYLRGEFQNSGWWYYYLYGLAIKVPIGTWLLLLLAIAMRCCVRSGTVSWRDEVVLLAPALSILIVVSSQTGFSEHFRYVLPAFPFIMIWIASVTQHLNRFLCLSCALCLFWSVSSSWFVFPHSLSYFNELVGGPREGHNHMIISSLDWGQDLLALRNWADRHPEAEPLFLAYYGDVNPAYTGLTFSLPPRNAGGMESDTPPKLEPGWYAISVNFLRGYPWRLIDGNGTERKATKHAFSYFKKYKPTAMAGYSIYIYHIPDIEL